VRSSDPLHADIHDVAACLELRKANEILRLASACFAQAELDRRFKP
jgi:hypothetical protein